MEAEATLRLLTVNEPSEPAQATAEEDPTTHGGHCKRSGGRSLALRSGVRGC